MAQHWRRCQICRRAKKTEWRAHKKRPAHADLFRSCCDNSLMFAFSAAMVARMIHMMMKAVTRSDLNRLKLKAGDAGRDVEPGLALHADRLQCVGIRRTADQEIAAAADADRCIGTDTAVSTR